jgi:hypothetical protein
VAANGSQLKVVGETIATIKVGQSWTILPYWVYIDVLRTYDKMTIDWEKTNSASRWTQYSTTNRFLGAPRQLTEVHLLHVWCGNTSSLTVLHQCGIKGLWTCVTRQFINPISGTDGETGHSFGVWSGRKEHRKSNPGAYHEQQRIAY